MIGTADWGVSRWFATTFLSVFKNKICMVCIRDGTDTHKPWFVDEIRQLTEMTQRAGGGEAPTPAQLAAAARGAYAAARAGRQTGIWLNHMHLEPKQ